MKSVGKNVTFWIWMLNKTVLSMLACVLLIGVMLSFTEGNVMEGLADFIPGYLFLITFLVIFINAMNATTIYFPVSISFGSARKQSCIGMQIAQHFVVIEMVLLLLLCNCIFPESTQERLMTQYPIGFVGVFLFLLGLGTMISAITIRCGRVLGVIVYIVVLLAISMGGTFMVFTAMNSSYGLDRLLYFLESPMVLPIGLLLDIGMAVVHYLTVRKMDLRFG